MPVERAAGGTSLIDVLDRVLDKGIVIDAWVRVSLVGIDLITVEARVVVASIDTYLKYSEAVGQATTASRPALETKPYEEVIAENAALRAQLQSGAPASRTARSRRRTPARRQDARAKANGARRPGDRRRRPARRSSSTARLRLLEGFLSRTEIADCAQHALQWLGEVARRPAVDLPDQAVGGIRRCSPSASHGLRVVDDRVVRRLARRLGQSARSTRSTRGGEAFYPAVAFRSRSAPPALDAVRGRGVSRRAARRRPASATRRSACCCSAAARRPRPSCAGSRSVFARSSIRFSGSRRSPKAIASRDASARCSTASSTRSPTRFC